MVSPEVVYASSPEVGTTGCMTTYPSMIPTLVEGGRTGLHRHGGRAGLGLAIGVSEDPGANIMITRNRPCRQYGH